MSFSTELIPLDNQKLMMIEQQQTKEKAKQLMKDTQDLQLIMNDLNELLIDQSITIESTNEKMIETTNILNNTNEELEKAKQYQQTMGIFKMSSIFALVGLAIGGPLGIVGGYYTGITVAGGLIGTVAGAGIGGGTAYSVIKTKQRNQKIKEIENENEKKYKKNN